MIQYVSNFLYQILIRYEIYKIFYIKFKHHTRYKIKFPISNFDRVKKSKNRWRERKMTKESHLGFECRKRIYDLQLNGN